VHQVGLAAPSYLQRLESIHGWTRALELDLAHIGGSCLARLWKQAPGISDEWNRSNYLDPPAKLERNQPHQ